MKTPNLPKPSDLQPLHDRHLKVFIVARRLGCSKRHVNRLIHMGLLTACRQTPAHQRAPWLVSERSLKVFMKARQAEGVIGKYDQPTEDDGFR